jgi:hypothetical protein
MASGPICDLPPFASSRHFVPLFEVDRITTDRRILFFLTYLSGRQVYRSEPATADGLMTDRRILFFLTYLSGRRAYRSEPATADGLTTVRRILFFLTYLSGHRVPIIIQQHAFTFNWSTFQP